MKVKDCNFKYSLLEVIFSNIEGTNLGRIMLAKDTAIKRDFADYEVLSVKNFEDTKTTSVMIHDERLENDI